MVVGFEALGLVGFEGQDDSLFFVLFRSFLCGLGQFPNLKSPCS